MKSILITGCSSGIGLDAALAFRDAGWKVIASCRKPADCAIMRDQHKMHSICIDYENEASITKGFADALAFTDGHLDVLFNNGAYGIPALVEDLPTAVAKVPEAMVSAPIAIPALPEAVVLIPKAIE